MLPTAPNVNPNARPQNPAITRLVRIAVFVIVSLPNALLVRGSLAGKDEGKIYGIPPNFDMARVIADDAENKRTAGEIPGAKKQGMQREFAQCATVLARLHAHYT